MKHAVIVPSTLNVLCPVCDQPITSLTGSLDWDLSQVFSAQNTQAWLHCPCGQACTVIAPARVAIV